MESSRGVSLSSPTNTPEPGGQTKYRLFPKVPSDVPWSGSSYKKRDIEKLNVALYLINEVIFGLEYLY